MLMMQGMAGIGPHDSRWVANRLFEGFHPSPMPCCGPIGGKPPEAEHGCCRLQREAEGVAVAAPTGQEAFARYRRLFQASPSSLVRQSGPDPAHPAPGGPPGGKSPGLSVQVLPGGEDDTLPPSLQRAPRYRVCAVHIKIQYNRFGSFDPDGLVYVLEEDREKVLAGQGEFNGGHDPLFHGAGRDGGLFLKNRDGEEVKAPTGQRIPVLTTEPLALRMNRGETIVIDFVNLIDQPAAPRANLQIQGARYDDSQMATPEAAAPRPAAKPGKGYQVRYVVTAGAEEAAEGTYYFHSQPILPGDRHAGIELTKDQVAHGLFGALIVEPPGSRYYDVSTFRIKEGSENGYGDYDLDRSGYLPIRSGWGAVVANDDPRVPAFREYVLFFHDNLGGMVKHVHGAGDGPYAISYRTEPFENLWNPTLPGERRPFETNDKSMAYSAYFYGDASTPHPRFYVGDPMRYRVVHAGMGDEFHVFHHHAHRWRFQPGVTETGATGERGNATQPSKFGQPEFSGQPDLTNPVSTRIDSQTLAPGETFDVVMEGGAGGVQRSVGDALLHCHIIRHVSLGMWTYARVYNTLQRAERYQPGLAPLPGVPRDLTPPIAVDSVKLAEMARSPNGPKTVPVSGPLAGQPIRDVENVLHPFLTNQLPKPGIPVADEIARNASGKEPDTVPINRANVWDWMTIPAGGKDLLFLGEKYDSDPASKHRVRFGVGFPIKGEGLGIDRQEKGPDGRLLDRPRLLFNPRDGRLAYPHLLPHAGRRPPFAPRTSLQPPIQTGQPWLVVESPATQGTAFLGPRLNRTDPGYPLGPPTGGGLAPADAKAVRHYDLVAIQLPIDYATHSGARIASVMPKVDFGSVVTGGGGPSEKVIRAARPMQWEPGTLAVMAGDVIEWRIGGGPHGLAFVNGAQAREALEFLAGFEVKPQDGFEAPVEATHAKDGGTNVEGALLVRARVKAAPKGATELPFFCTVHGKEMSGKLVFQAATATQVIRGAGTSWNPAKVSIKAGDVIEWRVESGTHGVMFENWDEAKKVLDVDGGLPVGPQDGYSAPAQGTEGKGGADTLLLRARVRSDLPPGVEKVLYFCTIHDRVMAGELLLVGQATSVDPRGQIFVLADDVPDVMAGRKPAEPLVLRANVGEVIDITLRSALVDEEENFRYSKVGIHTHLVQYDVQSSDGAVGGLNFETSIRPSLKWDNEKKRLVRVCTTDDFRETVHYRWWCDVELGTVYFHDHSILFNSLPHGLFGATVVEPSGAKYYDPVTGRPTYRKPDPDGVTRATDGRGTTVADVRVAEGRPKEGGFREFVSLFDDGNKDAAPGSINLRSEPLTRNGKVRWFWETRPFEVLWQNGQPRLLGGTATAFSSRLYGDPATPLLRAFPGDPFRVRVEGAGTDSVHTMSLFGHRWRYERNSGQSTPRDFVLAGVSEAFSFESRVSPGSTPGDYLYGSQGVQDFTDRGTWGLFRVLPPNTNSAGGMATGTVRVYIDRPAKVTVKKGKEFVSRRGVVYVADNETISMEAVSKNATGRFRSVPGGAETAFYFDLTVVAREADERANLPTGAQFGTDPTDLFESATGQPRILTILSVTPLDGGRSGLTPLPGGEKPKPGLPPGKGGATTGGPVPAGPDPDAGGEPTFHVAAVDVPAPAADPPASMLAYVPLATKELREFANRITEKARRGEDAGEDITKLATQLRDVFRKRPEPLVLRVSAPANAKAPASVTVRLTNLLPHAAPGGVTPEDYGDPVTSLHAGLIRYDVTRADGAAVGENPHSLVVRGDSRTYVWEVDQELGACLLRDMAVPSHQKLGLFGALIIEPAGSQFSTSGPSADDPGTVAVVRGPEGAAFREFVLFAHDGFPATRARFAINYSAAANAPGTTGGPALAAHSADSVRVRLLQVGQGRNLNHAFFVGGRRWPFDPESRGSNQVGTIAAGPGSAFNLHFTADPDVRQARRYFYGSRVGTQIAGGEWGILEILPPGDPALHPLEAPKGKP